jgi:hypothetical protein
MKGQIYIPLAHSCQPDNFRSTLCQTASHPQSLPQTGTGSLPSELIELEIRLGDPSPPVGGEGSHRVFTQSDYIVI